MPACSQVPCDTAPNEALIQHFKSDLARTWNAWCLTAASMRNSGSDIASPLLLPARALWIDPLDRSGTFLARIFIQKGTQLYFAIYRNLLFCKETHR